MKDGQAGDFSSLVVALTMASILLTAGSASAAEARPNWRVEWNRTVEVAKREGQVAIYGPSPVALITDAGVFQKAYPDIKIVRVTPSIGAHAVQRLLAERRAEKHLADLVIGGSTTPAILHKAKVLDPIRPTLVLPEVVDESKWWERKHRYIDPEGKYIFMYMGHPQAGDISYNTKLASPKEFKSLWDFLNPKWKGKIEMRDFRIPGTGSNNMRFIYYHPDLGPDFITRLVAEMDITLFRDNRQSVDWLAAGKFALCFFCYPDEMYRAQGQGLPVDRFGFMKEGAALTSHSGTIGLVNKAPHPNAAKVFTNWLLSREGQLTLQIEYAKSRRGGSNSLRIDIPKDMLPTEHRLIEGINYLDVESPERMDMGPIIKLFEESLADAGRRRKQ